MGWGSTGEGGLKRCMDGWVGALGRRVGGAALKGECRGWVLHAWEGEKRREYGLDSAGNAWERRGEQCMQGLGER